MKNIRLIIQYNGAAYSGWQYQVNAPSIQRTIEEILKDVLREKVRLIGASRTDAGVHARGQTANFKTSSSLAPRSIKSALNSLLPRDIVISGARRVPDDFNSQYDARSKWYRYLIANTETVSPFMEPYAMWVSKTLDPAAMRRGAQCLVGKHDFRSFQSKAGERENSVRTISDLAIKKKGSRLTVDIEGDGFLYNMARSIVGTLVDVGKGRFGPADVRSILNARDRRRAGPTAPAKGLFLMKVRY
ncbi:MAG: tRNA pseudouridine(38-40) synthase TruA [Candidatus Omnitrophota bacterium]